jgi:alkaline phosphatase D
LQLCEIAFGYDRFVITRRGFLAGTAAGAATLACGPRSGSRRDVPLVTHGVQAGIVDAAKAIVWARCSEPARMLVEWDTTDAFAKPRRIAGPIATRERDGAAQVAIEGLPVGQTIVYRVRFEREAQRGASDWGRGKLVTPRADKLRIAWTGDTCGQGYGRNPEWGGLKGFAAVRAAEPDLFINSGDLIYADNPIEATKQTPDGKVWKNVTNERVARVAEELDDFRARFAYNLEDDHVRALNAHCGSIVQWDDHETHNNWWPGQQLADDRYKREPDASKLAAFARQAMSEWCPLADGPIHRVVPYGPLVDVFVLDCRTFRTPNDPGAGTAMLGAQQAQWLVDALAASKARWKIIANDQPVSVLVGDGPNIEGWADGKPGAPVGREIELATILKALKQRGVKNLVWITADVHYAASTHFDPARAKLDFAFDPFFEFIAGPIHAGTFGPELVDPTFGAEVKWQWVPPPGTGNLPPWDGIQTFGTLDATPDALVVALWGIDGKQRYRVELPFTGA